MKSLGFIAKNKNSDIFLDSNLKTYHFAKKINIPIRCFYTDPTNNNNRIYSLCLNIDKPVVFYCINTNTNPSEITISPTGKYVRALTMRGDCSDSGIVNLCTYKNSNSDAYDPYTQSVDLYVFSHESNQIEQDYGLTIYNEFGNITYSSNEKLLELYIDNIGYTFRANGRGDSYLSGGIKKDVGFKVATLIGNRIGLFQNVDYRVTGGGIFEIYTWQRAYAVGCESYLITSFDHNGTNVWGIPNESAEGIQRNSIAYINCDLYD